MAEQSRYILATRTGKSELFEPLGGTVVDFDELEGHDPKAEAELGPGTEQPKVEEPEKKAPPKDSGESKHH